MASYTCSGCQWRTTRRSDLSRVSRLCELCQAARIVMNIMDAQILPPGFHMAHGDIDPMTVISAAIDQ